MKVFMLTQGSYSDYRVVAIFTTHELADQYALALATNEHERGFKQAHEDLAQYEREGSSWDEKLIKDNWKVWSKEEGRAERNAKEIRDARRSSYLRSIEHYLAPVKIIFDPDTYGGYQIEEQELYDMVPVVPND